jgi:hypothetical protein
MSARSARYFRRRSIDELHQAQASLSSDIRALHIRWANFYSDRLAQLNTRESDHCGIPD